MTAPTLGLAVSGGPDSLALLLIASAQEPVRVATVDHRLRPESRAEAEYVGAICANRGVPHDILTLAQPPSNQAEAREVRYLALADWCRRHGLTRLATGHHIDDQAETLLMRLARGAGLSGLAGVRAERPLASGIIMERPLLTRRKAELEEIVAEAGLRPVRDPSNEDPRYDRTVIRALLASTDVIAPERVAHSAAHLAEAEKAIEWMICKLEDERVRDQSFDASDLPSELVRRLMIRILHRHGIGARSEEVQTLIARLQRGEVGTLGSLLFTPGQRWSWRTAPPRRAGELSRVKGAR